MKKTNKKRALIASIAAFALVAGTYAMYVSNFGVENTFQVNKPTAKFVETFTPPTDDSVIFGGSYAKSGYVDNTEGKTDVKARVKITAGWINAEGQRYSNLEGVVTGISNIFTAKEGSVNAAILEFGDKEILNGFAEKNDFYATEQNITPVADAKDNWVYVDEDQYFYYGGKNGVLKAGENSSSLLKSVKFDKLLSQVNSTSEYRVTGDDPTINVEGIEVAGGGKIGAYKAEGYESQKEATDRVKAIKADNNTSAEFKGEIKFIQTSEFKETKLKGAKYEVKMEGQIISTDTDWDLEHIN